MKTIRFASLLIPIVLLFGSLPALAQETATQPSPGVEKVSLPVKIEPNEQRTYKVDVRMDGRMADEKSAKLVDVKAAYTMKVIYKYGRREEDGLLPLEISAASAKATVDGQELALPLSGFPIMTLLIDRSWKITDLFGIAGTRYASQMPGLNYSTMIMLFFVPEGSSPHAIGESWSSKIKLPGVADEATVKTTIKALGEQNGAKTVILAQDYAWPQRKLESGLFVTSKATAESVFLLDSGKLLKSHVEGTMAFAKSSSDKQESDQERANTKIDIALDK